MSAIMVAIEYDIMRGVWFLYACVIGARLAESAMLSDTTNRSRNPSAMPIRFGRLRIVTRPTRQRTICHCTSRALSVRGCSNRARNRRDWIFRHRCRWRTRPETKGVSTVWTRRTAAYPGSKSSTKACSRLIPEPRSRYNRRSIRPTAPEQRSRFVGWSNRRRHRCRCRRLTSRRWLPWTPLFDWTRSARRGSSCRSVGPTWPAAWLRGISGWPGI